MPTRLRRRVLLLKAGVWAACLIPLGLVLYRFFLGDHLGVNPIEAAEHWSGASTLIVLLGALAVTPVRRITGWNDLQKARRLIGLFAFFYACLHLLSYVVLDQFFAWHYIVEDIAKRPYILVGTTAFLLLLPLALTSTRGWIRRMGKNWTRLHRAIYVAGALGVIHWWWLVKADVREPAIAGGLLITLLWLRVVWVIRRRVEGGRARAARQTVMEGEPA